MAKTLTPTTIAVTINGNDYSKHVMFPFKVSNLLDEQLEEASLTLIGVPEKNFTPLTDVTVTLINDNKTQSYYMLVASDKADEIPTGKGKYKHELYLIEQTKYLECFIVRSIGYLNPLEKNYVQIPTIPTGSVVSYQDVDYNDGAINNVFNPYLTPQKNSIYVYGLRTDLTEGSPLYNKGLLLPDGKYYKNDSIWYGDTNWLDNVSGEPNIVNGVYVDPEETDYPSIQILNSNKEIVFEKKANYNGIGYDNLIPLWAFDMSPLNFDFSHSVQSSGLYYVVYNKCVIVSVNELNNNAITDRVFINVTYEVVVITP